MLNITIVARDLSPANQLSEEKKNENNNNNQLTN